MPRFTANLKAQDGSGHFRRVVLFADSEDQAREVLERRELERAWFRLTTDELAELFEGIDPSVAQELLDPDLDVLETLKTHGVTLNGSTGKLTTHRQAAPYTIEWLVAGRTPGPKGKPRKEVK